MLIRLRIEDYTASHSPDSFEEEVHHPTKFEASESRHYNGFIGDEICRPCPVDAVLLVFKEDVGHVHPSHGTH